MARRVSRRRFETSLQRAETPVFAFDAKRRLVFFNRGCETLTGWTADDVLGTVGDYNSEGPPQDVRTLAGILCPPPQVFAGQATQAPAYIVDRQGGSHPRMILFHPLRDSEGVVAVLGVMTGIETADMPKTVPASQRLHAELAALRTALRNRYDVNSLVVAGERMRRVVEQIALARYSQSAVLVTGETGTGKEHVARTIHTAGEHRSAAFVPLDCSRVPARELRRSLRRLLQEGGVTSSDEAAVPPGVRPGSLFLKDVESLSRDVQEMLVTHLRPAEGAASAVRLMASTTLPDLREAVEQDTLREDFYCLLTPLQIELPPLRNRLNELDLLVQAFLEEFNRDSDRQVGGISEAVREQFCRYRWPGNLDELRAVLHEAREMCDGPLIETAHLPFRFRAGVEAQSVSPRVERPVQPLDDYLAEVEAETIRATLQQTKHNKTQAAKVLGLTRPKLYRRMEALGIADEDEDDRDELLKRR